MALRLETSSRQGLLFAAARQQRFALGKRHRGILPLNIRYTLQPEVEAIPYNGHLDQHAIIVGNAVWGCTNVYN